MNAERFWSLLNKLPDDGCWEWTGCLATKSIAERNKRLGLPGKPMRGTTAKADRVKEGKGKSSKGKSSKKK